VVIYLCYYVIFDIFFSKENDFDIDNKDRNSRILKEFEDTSKQKICSKCHHTFVGSECKKCEQNKEFDASLKADEDADSDISALAEVLTQFDEDTTFPDNVDQLREKRLILFKNCVTFYLLPFIDIFRYKGLNMGYIYILG